MNQIIKIILLYTLLSISCQQGFSQKLALKIAPGVDNPRNSEGDFITLKDGRILFIYSRYTGESTSDHAPAYLSSRFSMDGGESWSKDDRLEVSQEGDMNVMSVSLLRLHDGKIALFYLRKNSTSDCIPMMRVSTDEAKSWSEPKPCITDREGYFVLNNNRVVQLKNGRLLMPVAMHKSPDGPWQEAATLYSYFSDDNGLTWNSGVAVPNTKGVVTQEPGVVELKDGRVMMFIRSDSGFQQLSYSKDQGETWSHIVPSTIHSPLSPASIARIPSTGDLLLVWNNNKEEGDKAKARTPLTVAISKDEGQSWENIKNIEQNPDGWYCYIAIHFTKEGVLLGYCAGSQAAKTRLSVTDITVLSQKWLYK